MAQACAQGANLTLASRGRKSEAQPCHVHQLCFVHPDLPRATMRTSKISRDTAKVIQALTASDRPRRQTRSLANKIARFALPDGGTNRMTSPGLSPKEEEDASSASTSESLTTEDIEDTLAESSRKRRRGHDSPAATITAVSTSAVTTRNSPCKPNIK